MICTTMTRFSFLFINAAAGMTEYMDFDGLIDNLQQGQVATTGPT